MRNDSAPKKHGTSAEQSFAKTDLAYWRRRLKKPPRATHWHVEIQRHGVRHELSLESANREAAAAKARDLYEYVRVYGWEQTLAKYRPRLAPHPPGCTLGQYVAAAKRTADIAPRTLETYCRSVRKIASDMLGLVDNGKRYNGRAGGGRDAWLAKVDAIKLSEFTPAQIAAWKKSFLSRAGSDPKSQRNARVSVNFYLRSAKSLFGSKVRENLGTLFLPEPIPFAEVQIERPSAKYFASFDLEELIRAARQELSECDPEVFKVLLLSAMAGLRRKEIDLLPWPAFRWEAGTIRVEHTKHFTPKTADSAGDVAVDPELLALFRGYYAQDPRAEFVIESQGAPRAGVLYNHYRCEKVFGRLTDWLRSHGVGSAKPIHELRKAFGSVICERAGIHQASRSLRHSDIRVTSAVYVDSRSRVSVGFGHLLAPPTNITPISANAEVEREKPALKVRERATRRSISSTAGSNRFNTAL
jgi:hypothetical protein